MEKELKPITHEQITSRLNELESNLESRIAGAETAFSAKLERNRRDWLLAHDDIMIEVKAELAIAQTGVRNTYLAKAIDKLTRVIDEKLIAKERIDATR